MMLDHLADVQMSLDRCTDDNKQITANGSVQKVKVPGARPISSQWRVKAERFE